MHQEELPERGSSDSEEYEDNIPEFKFQAQLDEQVSEDCQSVFVALYGIQTVWLHEQFKVNNAKRLGYFNFSKATQTGLATILYDSNNKSLAVLFNREIKDYHYNDYNFGLFLGEVLPKKVIQQAEFYIFTDLNVKSLARQVEIEGHGELRKISRDGQINGIKYIETPNELQGLFADVYTWLLIQQSKVSGLFIEVKEYEANSAQLDVLSNLKNQFPFLSHNVSNNRSEQLRALNKSKFKDVIYL